jgi:hypothetical protein
LHGQYVSLLGYREGVQGLLQRLGQSQLAWPEEYSLQAQASFAQAYGVSEEQLVCLLLTPFEARGRNQSVMCNVATHACGWCHLHRACRGALARRW